MAAADWPLSQKVRESGLEKTAVVMESPSASSLMEGRALPKLPAEV